MPKQKNTTGRNQSVKAHKNGIKKAREYKVSHMRVQRDMEYNHNQIYVYLAICF